MTAISMLSVQCGLLAGAAACWLATACVPRPAAPAPPVEGAPITLVVAERGPRGPRLVAVDAHGDRQLLLVREPDERARDANPVVSPDGRWVVFASSRGRAFDETRLWIAPLAPEATPVPLTTGPAIDSHPAWAPDGTAIVFASTRAGGDFDLWRLPIAGGRAAGPPVQLTDGPGHEVTPTVARDGAVIYAAVTPTGTGREIESHLEERAPDGTIRVLTAGPGDVAPALAPDGVTLAFARPLILATGASSELWRMARAGGEATPVVALPLTDESGPVWSRDGTILFATSVLRGEAGVLFSAVVFVDLTEPVARARILQDQAGPIARLTPAVGRGALDVAHLRGEPAYLVELARLVAGAAAALEDAGAEPRSE